MKIIKNEKGIALALVLVLSVIILAITAAVLFLVTQGTKSSGMEKRFRTALEASLGGAEFMYEVISLRGAPTEVGSWCGNFNTCSVSLNETCVPCSVDESCISAAKDTECQGLEDYNAAYEGLETKLRLPTFCWSSACDSAVTINPATGSESTYDVSFQLGGDPTDITVPVYEVFVKIIDSTYGNSGISSTLKKTGVVISNPGEVVAPQIVYLYTIEVTVQDLTNPQERAKTSVLYAF